MKNYNLTINGESVTNEKTLDIINPATEEIFAHCPDASKHQVDDAVTAADQAFKTWQLDENKRRQCFVKSAEVIEQHTDELARLLTQEQGKPLARALDEVSTLVNRFKHTASMQIPVTVLQDDEKIKVAVYHRPLGVTAVITPWNYPLSIAGKIAVPLLLGNTVVIKPSPFTPLTTLKLGELIRDIFPAGVVNVISGGDNTGAWLTQHPLVRLISFTGSVPTGKTIAKVAAEDLKRVTLELGGNDPAIVLADADPKTTAEKLFWGAFSNTGQICIAIKRLYAHEKIYQPLMEELSQLAHNVKLGNGLEADTELGPLNNKPQLDIVTNLVNDAKSQGADIVTGGKRLDQPGYFYQPTLVTNISDDANLVVKEQFGPALPVMTFTDVEDAIQRANNTMMGLGASVWSADWQQASQVAARLQSGTAWVNRNFASHPDAPFGGFKHSGLGREGGLWSIEAYSEVQTLSINKAI